MKSFYLIATILFFSALHLDALDVDSDNDGLTDEEGVGLFYLSK